MRWWDRLLRPFKSKTFVMAQNFQCQFYHDRLYLQCNVCNVEETHRGNYTVDGIPNWAGQQIVGRFSLEHEHHDAI